MPTPSDLLYDALRMREPDIDQLSRTIRRRYSEAYKAAISKELEALGRPERGQNPSGAELETIRGFVDRDITSITDTYHRELRSQIDKVLASNPSLTDAKAQLVAWEQARAGYKEQQIITASRGNGAEYGRGLFFQRNRLTSQKFTWDATPPIVVNSHQTCIARVQAGAVTWNEAKDWERVHPNCRHTRRLENGGAVTITGKVWTG